MGGIDIRPNDFLAVDQLLSDEQRVIRVHALVVGAVAGIQAFR